VPYVDKVKSLKKHGGFPTEVSDMARNMKMELLTLFTTKKSVTFTGACANEIIPSINRSFVYKAKEGRHVRMLEDGGY
jgi:hypothetical protein